jgi:RNA polymerase sigma factor (sigma-70 family)
VARPTADRTPTDPAELALREFVSAREAQDRDAMKRAWGAFVATELQRIAGIVATWPNALLPGSRVPVEAQDDVVGDALVRILRWLDLKGSSVGEARAMVASHTNYALLEYVRRYVKDDVGRAGSFDELAADGDGPGAIAREAEEQAAGRAPDELELAAIRVSFERALKRVDENKREVVVMRLAGIPGDDVAGRLGISRANVDQRNRRGLEQLREALGDES